MNDKIEGLVNGVSSNTEQLISRLEAEAERLADLLQLRESQMIQLQEALPSLKQAYNTSVKLFSNSESQIGKEEIKQAGANLALAIKAFQALKCSIENIRKALKDLHGQIDELTNELLLERREA